MWQERFVSYLTDLKSHEEDAAHDLAHFSRVAHNAQTIAKGESPSDSLILIASAYLHDLVNLPKNHPERHLSSKYSAEKARVVLKELRFPEEKIERVCHAIAAHSFTANITPETVEAKILQDADRLEALGALGILRTFYINGILGSEHYCPGDLRAKSRTLDDKTYALDHFYCKLLKLEGQFQTTSGRVMAGHRSRFLEDFIDILEKEVHQGEEGGAHFILKRCCTAGKASGKLACSSDPFAYGRRLRPHDFVTDDLLNHRDKFAYLPVFLKQLQEEIVVC